MVCSEDQAARISPLVSVITPVFNCCRFIEQTIESVRAQTHTDWELICVDDCSSDGSIALVQSFVEQDSRIQLIRLAVNSGAAVARNVAIAAARGTLYRVSG